MYINKFKVDKIVYIQLQTELMITGNWEFTDFFKFFVQNKSDR